MFLHVWSTDEMETETNAQFIMSPTSVNGCRKPITPKLLADIQLNKSFLKNITYYINFRFVTGVIQHYQNCQGSTEDMSLSPPTSAGII